MYNEGLLSSNVLICAPSLFTSVSKKEMVKHFSKQYSIKYYLICMCTFSSRTEL